MNPAEFAVRRRQAWTVARHELGRAVFSRRLLPVLLLVGMPLSIAVLRALFMPDRARADVTHSSVEFAQMYFFFHLRFVIFFACAVVFVKLFRGEILERSLHYSLLAPLRRDVLVLGKYVGGLLSAWLVVLAATAATFLLFYSAHGLEGFAFIATADGLSQLAGYLAVAALACLTYGALFLLAGLYFKNPMIPAVLFLGWEVATPFLPPALKFLSVVHPLASLLPVPPDLGPLAILAQPMDPWFAVSVLIAATGLLLWAASCKARRLEVTYAAD